MRAIRDNEIAASAMGKDVKQRHLQVFVLGSAVVGIAGAMLTTLDGQFTPTSYQPLRSLGWFHEANINKKEKDSLCPLTAIKASVILPVHPKKLTLEV